MSTPEKSEQYWYAHIDSMDCPCGPKKGFSVTETSEGTKVVDYVQHYAPRVEQPPRIMTFEEYKEFMESKGAHWNGIGWEF